MDIKKAQNANANSAHEKTYQNKIYHQILYKDVHKQNT